MTEYLWTHGCHWTAWPKYPRRCVTYFLPCCPVATVSRRLGSPPQGPDWGVGVTTWRRWRSLANAWLRLVVTTGRTVVHMQSRVIFDTIIDLFTSFSLLLARGFRLHAKNGVKLSARAVLQVWRVRRDWWRDEDRACVQNDLANNVALF